MTSGPPPLPISGPPPPVPEGWKAEWSGGSKTWYFFNEATQTSTWDNPLHKAPLPPGPPSYASSSTEKSNSTPRGLFDHHQPGPPINEATRPAPNTLSIHAACYHDQDITTKLRAMVTPQQTLSIRCDALTYHFGDPWPNHHKQFSILYSYGSGPRQLIAALEGSETIKLHPLHPVEKQRVEFVQQESRVVAVVWGTKNALDENVAGRGMRLMEMEQEGRLEASCKWMGFDGCPGIQKVAVVYYREANGSVHVVAGREGETLRLPWNAFAGI